MLLEICLAHDVNDELVPVELFDVGDSFVLVEKIPEVFFDLVQLLHNFVSKVLLTKLIGFLELYNESICDCLQVSDISRLGVSNLSDLGPLLFILKGDLSARN